ncbi:MAG: putative Tic20 family protein [Saprospiraceae bacterium]|jgi:uncharacterized Tic20 family protein|tara:strand:- start:73 stop:465 length:393 start_codon:yes stop_codon:yes gene_type:complete
MEPLDDRNLNVGNSDFKPWGMELNQFCMLMHLSQMAGFVVPVAGMVLPILMWAMNKDQSDIVDQHGKNILNWMISSLIYYVISTFLIFVLIGIPLLLVIAICSIIFSIIGALKANDGIFYKYPLSIKFLD